MIRIAVTGPESSGKSTISELLAKEFNGELIPEFARAYLMERNGVYSFEDLDIIAEEQQKIWQQNKSKEILVCDTEMLVMKVWSQFKYNKVSDAILKLYSEQQFDHYFLCKPDIPWEDDPLREHPEERDKLFEIYLKELQIKGLSFTVLEGEIEARLMKAKKIISNFFEKNASII